MNTKIIAAIAVIISLVVVITQANQKREVEIPVIIVADDKIPRVSPLAIADMTFRNIALDDAVDERFPMKLNVKPKYKLVGIVKYNFTAHLKIERSPIDNSVKKYFGNASYPDEDRPVLIFFITEELNPRSVYISEIQRNDNATDVYLVAGYEYLQMADRHYDTVMSSTRELWQNAINRYVEANKL